MPEVERVLPSPARVGSAELLSSLRVAQVDLRPFDPAVVAFAADLSRRLRRMPDGRAHPALGALAFWIRPANLERLRLDWLAQARPGRARVPRGVAFHIPPTNVDTLFVYSWLLAALAGNANVVRLSPRARDADSPLLAVLGATLSAHPRVADTTAVVSYGHDDAVTTALSEADVRVIWGGDDSVRAIRRLPLAPHATELAFPDRFSLALLDAAAVLALDERALADLAARFYNDAYWFDQLGCASPRVVVWRGPPADADAASGRFLDALGGDLARRGHEVATGVVMAKLVHASDVASHGVLTGLDRARNALTVARVARLADVPRDSPGGGLFYSVRVDDLGELVGFVQRRDQTLSTFGVPAEELRALALALNGRGIDRIVPVGQALAFGPVWDGWDLLDAFSRVVALDEGDHRRGPLGSPGGSP